MSATISDYERLRLENIERNRAFLDGIGISGARARITAEPITAKGLKRKKTLAQIPPERRSSRISSIELRPDYKEVTSAMDAAPRERVSARPRGPPQVDKLPAPDSSRSHEANLDAFLGESLGSDSLAAPRKEDIMRLASQPRAAVSFNKYSGVVEWRNAIFLWVNLIAGADYPNEFSESGRRLSWFGGSKMYEESPSVQRLLRAGAGETCLLFVRFEKESYVCLGTFEMSVFYYF